MDENSNLPTDNKGTNLIKQFIINNYEPASNYLNATVRLTTAQLHTRMTAMYPEADLTVCDLYTFLRDQGYIEVEVRPFYTEWLFDKKGKVL